MGKRRQNVHDTISRGTDCRWAEDEASKQTGKPLRKTSHSPLNSCGGVSAHHSSTSCLVHPRASPSVKLLLMLSGKGFTTRLTAKIDATRPAIYTSSLFKLLYDQTRGLGRCFPVSRANARTSSFLDTLVMLSWSCFTTRLIQRILQGRLFIQVFLSALPRWPWQGRSHDGCGQVASCTTSPLNPASLVILIKS